MDKTLQDKLKDLEEKVRKQSRHASNEADVKAAFIEPFFQLVLGYAPNDLTQVKREYPASLDGVKSECVDYGLLNPDSSKGPPNLIVECKGPKEKLESHITQLKQYFIAIADRHREAPFGVLTNGRRWLFFADFQKSLIMDDAPFLSFDLLRQPRILAHWLAHWNLKHYDRAKALKLAWELRHNGILKELFISQIQQPGDSFLDFVHRRLQNYFRQTIDNDELIGSIQKASHEIIGEWYSYEEVRKWSDQVVPPGPAIPSQEEIPPPLSTNPKPKPPTTIVEYAIQVLKQEKRPLTQRVLARRILAAGYISEAKDPVDSIEGSIYGETRKTVSRLVKTGNEYRLPKGSLT